MKKLILLLTAVLFSLLSLAESNEIINRPFRDFSTSAFVSYQGYHPSQYIKDNNWQILCAFITPNKVSRLDTLNIHYNKSQLRLLEVGGLLECYGDSAKTIMPIFDKGKTDLLRQNSKQFVDSIYPTIEPKIKKLLQLFNENGYSPQSYSLIFSWLLDGIIWGGNKLPRPTELNLHPTWSGSYWATYSKRAEEKVGTNSYGPVSVNWSDELGYWPGDKLLINIAKAIMAHPNNLTLPDSIASKASAWSICDASGKISVPVLRSGEVSPMNQLADNITTQLSNAIKEKVGVLKKKFGLSNVNEAAVIFYHEVMWDLLSKLEQNNVIVLPAILKGEEVGKAHFNEIMFIRLE